MLDFLSGILAIVGVILILLMKESENKWVVYAFWIIILLSKIF